MPPAGPCIYTRLGKRPPQALSARAPTVAAVSGPSCFLYYCPGSLATAACLTSRYASLTLVGRTVYLLVECLIGTQDAVGRWYQGASQGGSSTETQRRAEGNEKPLAPF